MRVGPILVEDVAPGGITEGDWLIAGATLLLALITLGLAYVGYRQLTSLRGESRRQRTYDLYTRYYSESFLEPRLAAKAALDRAEHLGIGLWAAYRALTYEQRVHVDRYVNFLEESSQQYVAGLLDRDVAEEGLAYLAWFHWNVWQDFINDQRLEQNTNRTCENWEYLHHDVDGNYSPPSNQAAEALARSWIDALGSRPTMLGRRLGRLVTKSSRFRVG